jgi:hypothetical protein
MVEEAIVFLLLSALLRFYRMLVVGDIKAELVGSPQVTGGTQKAQRMDAFRTVHLLRFVSREGG